MSPYNTNPSTIVRHKTHLDEIVRCYGAEIEIACPDPHMKAYGLREAIYAAEFHNIEPYCFIKYRFTERPKESMVLCRPKKGVVGTITKIQAPPEHSFPQAISAFDVVEIATTLKADIMSFPNFKEEVESVKSWAEGRGYAVISANPLTLKKAEQNG